MLTQFNSHTLNTHITRAYPPAVFGGPKRQGFVDVLACHQTPDYAAWYRGSADAVRRNLPVILEQYRGAGVPEELLILSGQAVYRMVWPPPGAWLELWKGSRGRQESGAGSAQPGGATRVAACRCQPLAGCWQQPAALCCELACACQQKP